MSWLREHAPASIRWRTVRDILPPGGALEADRMLLRQEVVASKAVHQVLRRQKGDGLWGDNILGVTPSRSQGIKDVGTVSQYRRLVELGVSGEERSMRLTDRLFFRLLSRDDDPELAHEYRKAAKADAEFGAWVRSLMRDAATAALAHSGQVDDPRVRGSAHRITSEVSGFLRSDLAEKPIIRKGARRLLHPDARVPTLFSVASIAYMPALQRERAGFVERLASYLARPFKQTFVIAAGKRMVKPTVHLLGDPLQVDSSGQPKDLAFALYWIELLARLGAIAASPTAQKCLLHLLGACDETGVWNPKGLRGLPSSPSHLADFAFPLEGDDGSAESKKVDVTFRLALIAKIAGWQLIFT